MKTQAETKTVNAIVMNILSQLRTLFTESHLRNLEVQFAFFGINSPYEDHIASDNDVLEDVDLPEIPDNSDELISSTQLLLNEIKKLLRNYELTYEQLVKLHITSYKCINRGYTAIGMKGLSSRQKDVILFVTERITEHNEELFICLMERLQSDNIAA